MRAAQTTLAALFALVLIFTGLLRLAAYEPSALTPIANLATPLYVVATIIFAVLLTRAGVQFNGFGFGYRLNFFHVVLAVAGVAALQLYANAGYPLVAEALGGAGDSAADDRFSDVEGSLESLLVMLAFSWTFAAIGEEIAFRIVLMRSLASGFGGGTVASVIALLVQAVIFGVVHFYKGPIGMTSSMVSGLVFGALVLASRGAIWPAFLAHGVNNTIGLLNIYDA